MNLETAMDYIGKLYGKVGRKYIPLKLDSADVDAAMAQNAMIPRSGIALAELLVKHGVIQSAAIDDPEGYDDHETLDRIHAAWSEMISTAPADVVSVRSS